VPGLPAGFRYHDLRHYLASLLIAHGANVKTVQARLGLDHVEQLQSPVARQRRVHEGDRGLGHQGAF
jgi:site-specific recombinase XerD